MSSSSSLKTFGIEVANIDTANSVPPQQGSSFANSAHRQQSRSIDAASRSQSGSFEKGPVEEYPDNPVPVRNYAALNTVVHSSKGGSNFATTDQSSSLDSYNLLSASMFYVQKFSADAVSSAGVKVLVVPEQCLINEISNDLVNWKFSQLPNTVERSLRKFIILTFRPLNVADTNILMLRIYNKLLLSERKVCYFNYLYYLFISINFL